MESIYGAGFWSGCHGYYVTLSHVSRLLSHVCRQSIVVVKINVVRLKDIALLNKSSQSYEALLVIRDQWITQCYLSPDTSEHTPP